MFRTLAPAFAILVALTAACSSSEPTTSSSSGGTGSSSSSTSSGGGSSSGGSSSGGSSSGGSSSGGSSGSSKQALGGICTTDAECQSNLCVFKGNSPRGVCTMLCNNVAECPGGFTKWDDCAEVQNVTGKVCIPKT